MSVWGCGSDFQDPLFSCKELNCLQPFSENGLRFSFKNEIFPDVCCAALHVMILFLCEVGAVSHHIKCCFQWTLWLFFAPFFLSLSCSSTAADLTMLLSSFSADAVCQHGTSLPGDRSPLFGSSSREVTNRRPLPFLPRQARRLLSCLVETAPLRLARSAAVRAQLRLPGTHVARFHLWVSVWPQEWVDISMLMHAKHT